MSGKSRALPPQSNPVQTLVMARAALVPRSGRRLEICHVGWLRGTSYTGVIPTQTKEGVPGLFLPGPPCGVRSPPEPRSFGYESPSKVQACLLLHPSWTIYQGALPESAGGRTMNCHEARQQFADLIAGTMGLTESARVDAHVSQCAECRDLLEGLYRLRRRDDNPEQANATKVYVDPSPIPPTLTTSSWSLLGRGLGCALCSSVPRWSSWASASCSPRPSPHGLPRDSTALLTAVPRATAPTMRGRPRPMPRPRPCRDHAQCGDSRPMRRPRPTARRLVRKRQIRRRQRSRPRVHRRLRSRRRRPVAPEADEASSRRGFEACRRPRSRRASSQGLGRRKVRSTV